MSWRQSVTQGYASSKHVLLENRVIFGSCSGWFWTLDTVTKHAVDGVAGQHASRWCIPEDQNVLACQGMKRGLDMERVGHRQPRM